MGKSPGINYRHITRKVKIYDVANKKLIKECNSKHEAMEYAGVKGIDSYLSSKCKCYKNKLGIVLAFR